MCRVQVVSNFVKLRIFIHKGFGGLVQPNPFFMYFRAVFVIA